MTRIVMINYDRERGTQMTRIVMINYDREKGERR